MLIIQKEHFSVFFNFTSGIFHASVTSYKSARNESFEIALNLHLTGYISKVSMIIKSLSSAVRKMFINSCVLNTHFAERYREFLFRIIGLVHKLTNLYTTRKQIPLGINT